MLSFRYSEVVKLSSGNMNLLFAAQEGGAAYSDLHMAAGERAILRLSQEIAQLKGALVLIDQVEASLHPGVQQFLMMQLHQLALRNDLQVIVTTHRPVVLDSVPIHGRIFLERDETGRVTVSPPYRDVVQDALYGRSWETLKILCEDESAEGIPQGVFDVLLPRRRIRRESVRIERNTGANEFPTDVTAFRNFGQIQNFAFNLDGDKCNRDTERKVRDKAGNDVPVFFLPSSDAPEIWVWDRLRQNLESAATELRLCPDDLSDRMNRLDSVYDSAPDPPSRITKAKLRSLSEPLPWRAPDICQVVSRLEADKQASGIQPLVEGLEFTLLQWSAT